MQNLPERYGEDFYQREPETDKYLNGNLSDVLRDVRHQAVSYLESVLDRLLESFPDTYPEIKLEPVISFYSVDESSFYTIDTIDIHGGTVSFEQHTAHYYENPARFLQSELPVETLVEICEQVRKKFG